MAILTQELISPPPATHARLLRTSTAKLQDVTMQVRRATLTARIKNRSIRPRNGSLAISVDAYTGFRTTSINTKNAAIGKDLVMSTTLNLGKTIGLMM